MGVSQDVTRQRESEGKLRRSEQLLRTTTANTADTLILVDTDLKIRFINRGSGSVSIDQIVGCEISAWLPESARGVVIAKLRHVLNTGETAAYEFESRDNGAEPRYFENRAVLVQDEGIGTGISISVADITERKRLEQEILDVSSRERHSIGRDLHDGLGQELTGGGTHVEKPCDPVPASVSGRCGEHQRNRGFGESVDRECPRAVARTPARAHRHRRPAVRRCASSRPAAVISTGST